jgi:hypothetical protein
VWARLAFAGIACAAGCKESSPPAPNQLPDTFIVLAPAEGGRTPNHLAIYYRGGDLDGTIAYYQNILHTDPRFVSDYATVQQRLQTPEVGDPRWTRVDAASLDLVVLADTLRADPRGDIGQGHFDRWHTFWVRAVDGEGGIDATPEGVSFDAYTKAPQVGLESPVVRGQTATLPSVCVMNWGGLDYVDGGEIQQPRQARWVLRRVQLDGGGQPLGYPDSLYDLPDSVWSAWKNWTAADSTGREAVVRRAVPDGQEHAYVFAIQGRDDGGAVTPQFDASTASANNYAVLKLDGSLPVGPTVVVRARGDSISSWTFADSIPPLQGTALTDTLVLTWTVQARQYGGNSRDCRYGWNITNPSDDGQWTAWSATGRTSAPHAFTAGVEEFCVQCRDQLRQVRTGCIVFVRASPRLGRW